MAKTFNICHDEAKGNALAYLAKVKIDDKIEVVFRNATESKTAAQLGGIFGSWETYISKEHGHSIAKVHDWIKATFLARIYVTDNAESPVNDQQAQWVELLAVYQLSGEIGKLEKHAKRISLSWATLKQTKQLMDDVESHFQDIGQPLPILDKDWKRKG